MVGNPRAGGSIACANPPGLRMDHTSHISKLLYRQGGVGHILSEQQPAKQFSPPGCVQLAKLQLWLNPAICLGCTALLDITQLCRWVLLYIIINLRQILFAMSAPIPPLPLPNPSPFSSQQITWPPTSQKIEAITHELLQFTVNYSISSCSCFHPFLLCQWKRSLSYLRLILPVLWTHTLTLGKLVF